MTIDKSTRILVDRYIDTYVVCGGENYNPAINITRQDCEAFHVAVDTMRKYQKIQEIVEHWACCGNPSDSMIAISEVLEDDEKSD